MCLEVRDRMRVTFSFAYYLVIVLARLTMMRLIGVVAELALHVWGEESSLDDNQLRISAYIHMSEHCLYFPSSYHDCLLPNKRRFIPTIHPSQAPGKNQQSRPLNARLVWSMYRQIPPHLHLL